MLPAATKPWEELREQLVREIGAWRSTGAMPGAWLMPEFVVRNGEGFTGRALPVIYGHMPPGRCFQNAEELAVMHGLAYYEGYVCREAMPMPIHHAWAVDADAQVVDPTLAEPESWRYFGVRFSLEELRIWRIPESASVMDLGLVVNARMMLARDAGLAALMAAHGFRLESGGYGNI